MIEHVTGKVIHKSPTFCVLDCHGIGLGLHISLNTFQHLEKYAPGEPVQLHAHLYVREDVLQLYGFADTREKQMFQLLITISGVGPRLALAILSGTRPDDLVNAISREDVGMLTRIPGVGKKTAQRVILELKEKLAQQPAIEGLTTVFPAASPEQSRINDALLALMALGFKQPEAQRAIDVVIRRSGDELSVDEIVRLALKEL
ncbi:MAG: Holliday junction branch migration protein RuvA [Calditrichaeota bacterium]|nr:MAG: Holliday junction branch migration protein RuvA [Calditrichota bacterium]